MSADAALRFDVHGVPVTEGSTRAFARMGRDGRAHAAVVHDRHAELDEWRRRVRAASLLAAREVGWPVGYDGPVIVRAVFYLPEPKRPRWETPAAKPDADQTER